MKARALLPVAILALVSCGHPEGYTPPAAPPDAGPAVTITLDFNLCPHFEFSMVLPRDVEPGESTDLIVHAKDPEGTDISYRWRAPTGSFSERDLPVTSYFCDEPGTVTLTVTAEDEDGCAVPRELFANCLE